MTTTTTPTTLQKFAAVYVRVWGLASNREVQEAQYQPGRSVVPREDTTERSRGLINDPTANIILDTRRVKLREAVLEAEKSLEIADRVLRIAERTLRRAHAQVDLDPSAAYRDSERDGH